MGKPKAPKSTQTTNQTTTNTPWAPATGALEDLVKQAQGAYAATPKTPVFTGPNATQTAGADALKAAAANNYYVDAERLRQGVDRASAPITWNADINPYANGVVAAAINPLRDQLDANVLSIGDAAKMAGAYGGDRGELLKGTALSRFNRDAMDVSSNILYQATEAERSRQFQAQQAEAQRQLALLQSQPSILQAAQAMGLQPGTILSDVGDREQQWNVAANTAAMDAPWAGLDRYATILDALRGYGTQTTQGTTNTTGTPGGGGLQGGLSGALGGASAGAALGPWGAGIGAVLGGLGGIFG